NKVMDYFNPIKERLTATIKTVKDSMIAWDDKQEALRQEEIRKEQERADKEKAKLEKRADAAEEKGQENKADDLRFKAETVTAYVPPPAEKTSGIAKKIKYSA